MKNRHQLLNILFLLPLVFLFGPNAYPQAKDPSRDLSVSWSSRRDPDPGSVFGSVTNRSANSYPCIRLEFDLATRFDLRKPGEQGKRLGVLPVEVRNISPRTVRNFEQPLPYPAGMGLKSVSECQPIKPVPGDMKILSFTITPANIVAGQTATLQWQTENSETVQVGMQNPEVMQDQRAERILKPRTVESSGSLQVTPSRTTTYELKATNGSLSSYARSVTVTVTNPVPGDMKILSFTITPANIVAGQTATLQWQTENSETVQVGMQNPEVMRDQRAERIFKPRTVESSGSWQVTPSRTTTYELKATKGSLSSYPRSVTVTVTNPVPNDMKILSFTITPANIVAGQTATLQWQTENSETVQVGMQNPEVMRNQRAERILKPRSVESSGSLQVTPSRTTTYELKATKGSLSSYARSVTVTVTNPPPAPPPQGFCTIFGRVSNDLREYATTIGIYRLDDSRKAVLTKRVSMGGEFSIPNVPVGEYNVIPRGSYPSSKMNIGPNPRARRIICQPAGSYPAYFKIQSNEG